MGSKQFPYTGGWQSWVVPAGVTTVTVYLNGGGSGSRPGGRVTGYLPVAAGQVYYVLCGGAGKAPSGETGGSAAAGGGGYGGDGKSGGGGYGGGGFSEVRLSSTSGTIKAVAGGAGGNSGDGGAGGYGGGTTGASGGRGTSGSGSTGAATGGTQTQGGNGGTSSSGSDFNGANASDVAVAQAGAGGASTHYSYGGGGGGGGWRSGGGGQASSKGYAPGGGGGGGSNYTGGLNGATTVQGYASGNGAATFTWVDPAPANHAPSPPTSVLVNGVAAADALPTKDYGDIDVSAIVTDPDVADTLSFWIRYADNSAFNNYKDVASGAGHARGSRVTITLTGLLQNTRYYCRLYAKDSHGLNSTSYNSINFWTNRPPIEPNLTAPAENASVPQDQSTVFTWAHNDLDPSDPMTGWTLQWRTAATATAPAGQWFAIDQPHNTSPTWTINPMTFRGNTFYEWQVRTRDKSGTPGLWAIPNSFYVTSLSSPPVPLSPINDVAVEVDTGQQFAWAFIDPDPGDAQSKADLRYRVVGQDDTAWVTWFGAKVPGVPGTTPAWTLPPDTFAPGYHYEWQVRTYDTVGTGTSSDWSVTSRFWATNTPGALAVAPVPDVTTVQGALGCGEYRVFVYAQGGKQVIGEITPLTGLNFKRVRDDISNCTIHSNGFGQDCCALYANLRCWMHELVVFRSGVRVWEGPITRIGYSVDSVEIEAKDVMAYLYRRILRQGFNDSYQAIPGSGTKPGAGGNVQALPVMTTVQRARWIVMNALAPWDPNVLAYLTVYQFPDDAKQSRIIEDYSQTAFEQVDDMAATAGLDYTVVGRRIIMWDTHRAIGKLPEMRDGDFSDPVVVTEYGMNLCNYMAVTNGSGVWGAVTPDKQTVPYQSYGPIEMVASGYSDSAAAASDVLTNAAKQTLVNTLTGQAKRNIAHRWPSPVIVRVPDNATLDPGVGVGFDQLIPGVWIPVRSAATCREVVQWQKLDSVTVAVDSGGGEQVQVVMSPAPNAGDDVLQDSAQASGEDG